eukprot:Skav220675  [mRNA]  locus=scaffold1914:382967:384189:- [translate_table: standard]
MRERGNRWQPAWQHSGKHSGDQRSWHQRSTGYPLSSPTCRQAAKHQRELHEARLVVSAWLEANGFPAGDANGKKGAPWAQGSPSEVVLLVVVVVVAGGGGGGVVVVVVVEVVFVTFPLHEAVKQNNAYLTSKLLLFGADPTIKDSWCRTAHDYAKRKSSTHPELLQIIDSCQRQQTVARGLRLISV